MLSCEWCIGGKTLNFNYERNLTSRNTLPFVLHRQHSCFQAQSPCRTGSRGTKVASQWVESFHTNKPTQFNVIECMRLVLQKQNTKYRKTIVIEIWVYCSIYKLVQDANFLLVVNYLQQVYRLFLSSSINLLKISIMFTCILLLGPRERQWEL